ncbi:hypothetical protein C2S53_002960 [Perilla frutescens var. hirtella]|uniref:Protein kinase domain-containing protein n=1 Tax=Perilla frutescens var. hirtella TaxID=608512 RepID=A0AAD4IYS1_PERFH|nr:hypothetical protein C2S53_002960 [Perilla frutescens var. hirtella]
MSAIYDNWERLVGNCFMLIQSASAPNPIHLVSVFLISLLRLMMNPFSFSSFVVEDHFHAPVVNLSTTKNSNSRKRDLKIQVLEFKQLSYPLPLPPGAMPNSSNVSPPKSPSQGYHRDSSRFIHLVKLYLDFTVGSEKGGMCVMKEIPLSFEGEKKKQSARMKENIVLLSHMRHPNIVRYYGSEMVADKFFIYYEYMSRGTIYMILDQYGTLGEPAIQSCTQTNFIWDGISTLQKIAHWNIRGADILLDPNGIVKLTNFGIHKQIAEKCRTSWLMDSPYWMAPEVIMNPNVRNSAADIWSLGCTVLEMATLKPPLSQYDGVVASFKVAHHMELPTVPVHLSDACKDILRQCLQWNPLHRATASQLLEHPFVKDLSPLGERILVSTSSGHPAVTNAVNVIYTPRSVLAPTSPAGSPLLHQRSRQQFTRRMSPPPESTPRTSSSSSAPISATQHPHRNKPMLRPETFRDFAMQSPNSNSPSYWDPNILRGMFRSS